MRSHVVAIHQPAYLPWLGYFDRIQRADQFIYLDTVQFQKNSFQNRNKVRTPAGWIWLTVPVLTKGRLFEAPLKEIGINNQVDWRRKHLGALQANYARAPYYDDVMSWLRPYYERRWERLSELCLAMLNEFLSRLKISTPVVKASDLPPTQAKKSGLVLELCKQAGATTYLSGMLGKDYLDLESFREAGIAVEFHDYEHPAYEQAHPGFEPAMGVVDYLMCTGKTEGPET